MRRFDRLAGLSEERQTLWWAMNHNGVKLHKKPLPIEKAARELMRYEAATGNTGSITSASS